METITVLIHGCGSETYWLIYITVWMLLRRKLFYFNDLIVFRTFSLLKFQYSKIITLISNRNYHSLKTWGWEWTLPSFFNTDWLLFRRKLLYFNDLTPNSIFLLLKSSILALKGSRNCFSSKHCTWLI